MGQKRNEGDAMAGGTPKKARLAGISEERLQGLVEASKARFQGMPQENYPWLELFQVRAVMRT